ncbi:MAG: succinate dehydrogenase assembly factor 2 [Gammaproteobacteria bacterium]|nr:succinate dehydrogenase assembly factor 2 [Gammaproteobacteria bacterium]
MSEQDRLRWHCRRGTRELDLMLMRYLDQEYPRASTAEQAAFARLLERPDPELQEMFLGAQTAPDPEMESVAQKIRAGTPDHD